MLVLPSKMNQPLLTHAPAVDSGNTVTDFLPMERQRGITIQSAAITFTWPPRVSLPPSTRPKTINLIDTPGHQDFRFEVDRCLPILDGAICILDAVKGVEAHTERVWASAHEHRVPRIVYVNKMDLDGASFHRSVMQVAARLGGWPLLCQIPWWSGDEFGGVIDVIEETGYRWNKNGQKMVVPRDKLLGSSTSDLAKNLATAREKMVETLAERDSDVMDAFLNQDITPKLLKKAIRNMIRSGDASVIPVFVGSSKNNIGVELLLDAVNDYLPSPNERPALEIKIDDESHVLQELMDKEAARHPAAQDYEEIAHKGAPHHHSKKQRDREPMVESVSSVFKIFEHPQQGILCFVRVYYGSLARNVPTYNTSLEEAEKPMGVLQIAASDTHDLQSLETGHIGALRGHKKSRTGDTLITVKPSQKPPPESLRAIKIRPPIIPPPVASLAILTYSTIVTKQLHEALETISREDPSLQWTHDEDSDEFIIQGMGKLHLEVVVDTLKKRFDGADKVTAGEVQVEYREALIEPSAPQTVVFDKALAGKQGKVTCTATARPITAAEQEYLAGADKSSQTLPPGFVEKDGNFFEIHMPGRSDKFNAFRKDILAGASGALARGPRRGSPLGNTHVTITLPAEGGHISSPSPGHFSSAARLAVQRALASAHEDSKICILEPVMLARITCPEQAARFVQHDISSSAEGQVLEVRDLTASASGSSTSDQIQLDRVWAPKDPYETETGTGRRARGEAIMRMVEIVARLPLKNTLDYDAHLRKRTSARHSMSTYFGSWDRVSGAREKEL